VLEGDGIPERTFRLRRRRHCGFASPSARPYAYGASGREREAPRMCETMGGSEGSGGEELSRSVEGGRRVRQSLIDLRAQNGIGCCIAMNLGYQRENRVAAPRIITQRVCRRCGHASTRISHRIHSKG